MRSPGQPSWTTAPRSPSRPELPTPELAEPGLATVALGLASAIAWGAGDFGGGWTGRRAPVLGIGIGIDAIGVVIILAVALAIGEPMPGSVTLLLSTIAGVLAVAGLLGLYAGLAVGRMGVVAPVTALIAAILPVVVGFVRQGLPGIGVMAGIGCALVAVVLVSRSSDPAGRRSGIEYAIVGGIGIGLFNVVVGAFPEHRVAWPLAIIKGTALVTTAAIVLIGRRPWRVPSPLLPAVATVAVLDLVGTGFYVLATQAGRLDVAATLSSLYPVTTIVLAIALLHERVSRSHLAGIIMAGLGIVLIAGGSATPA